MKKKNEFTDTKSTNRGTNYSFKIGKNNLNSKNMGIIKYKNNKLDNIISEDEVEEYEEYEEEEEEDESYMDDKIVVGNRRNQADKIKIDVDSKEMIKYEDSEENKRDSKIAKQKRKKALNYINSYMPSEINMKILDTLFRADSNNKYLYFSDFNLRLNPFRKQIFDIQFNKYINQEEKIKLFKNAIMKSLSNNKNEYEDDYDAMPFSYAVRKDKRPFKQIFKENVKENVLLIYIIKLDSYLIPFCLKVSMISFYFFSSLFLSAFTYKEDYIKNDFEGYDSIIDQIYDYFERASISATFLLYLVKITFIMISIVSYFELYKKEEFTSNKEKVATQKDILDYYVSRPYYYFALVIILSFIYWYFLIIFGNIFVNTQIKVIITFFVTIGINLLLEILASFLHALLRTTSLSFKSMYFIYFIF